MSPRLLPETYSYPIQGATSKRYFPEDRFLEEFFADSPRSYIDSPGLGHVRARSRRKIEGAGAVRIYRTRRIITLTTLRRRRRSLRTLRPPRDVESKWKFPRHQSHETSCSRHRSCRTYLVVWRFKNIKAEVLLWRRMRGARRVVHV